MTSSLLGDARTLPKMYCKNGSAQQRRLGFDGEIVSLDLPDGIGSLIETKFTSIDQVIKFL
jgi:hypothetical protein